jgi:AraC family transcriptional regulator, transcriptional activator of pobA
VAPPKHLQHGSTRPGPPTRLVSALPQHSALAVHRLAPCRGPVGDAEVVHDHAGLGFYLSGTTRLWMSLDYTLTRGDVLLLPEGMPHATRSSDRGDLWGVMLCSTCMRGSWGEALREALQHVRLGRSPVRRLDEAELVRAERLLSELAHELTCARPAQGLMVDGLMAQLVALITRAAQPLAAAPHGDRAPRLVSQALAYVEKHGARGISLRDVAKAVGRSPAHVASLVKEHTGRTVVGWITHARMARARELLMASDASVDAIAEQVGFGSASHFHRTFRKHHDASPSAWRAAHRS